MTTQILKIIFLLAITVCAVVAFGSGLFVRKKKYKDNNATRERKLMRIRAICFLIMLVLLLIVILI